MHQIYFWINVACGTIILIIFLWLVAIVFGTIRELLRKITK